MKIRKKYIPWGFSFLLLSVLCLYRTPYVYGGGIGLRVLNVIDIVSLIWAIGLFISFRMYRVKCLWIMALMPFILELVVLARVWLLVIVWKTLLSFVDMLTCMAPRSM